MAILTLSIALALLKANNCYIIQYNINPEILSALHYSIMRAAPVSPRNSKWLRPIYS